MSNGDRLPAASGSMDRGTPRMRESAGAQDLLRQLATQGGGGPGGGGMGNEEQAANLVMQGAQILMQAAQLHPALLPAIQRAIDSIKGGVQSMATGAGGGPPSPPREAAPIGRRRKSPRKVAGEEDVGGDMTGGAQY